MLTRLLTHHVTTNQVLAWSHWRRRHQARAPPLPLQRPRCLPIRRLCTSGVGTAGGAQLTGVPDSAR
jgi:hypothetical protein